MNDIVGKPTKQVFGSYHLRKNAEKREREENKPWFHGACLENSKNGSHELEKTM